MFTLSITRKPAEKYPFKVILHQHLHLFNLIILLGYVRSRSLALVSAGLLGLASMSEGSIPRKIPALPRAELPSFSGPLRYCAECDTFHDPREEETKYELVTGLGDISSVERIFKDMRDEITTLESLAVTGVTMRHRDSDDSLKLHPEEASYPGQSIPPTYAETSFILVYVNVESHPSTFTLRVSRDGTNIFSQPFDLATEPPQRGFLLFNPGDLAPQDYRLHGPAKYTIETLVADDEDPDGEPRVEQTLEFFIEYR